ncbi:MAG TPA: lysylphosphatidylglycerol synthase domain-containing protein [Gaiellaceae bacterium]
MVAVVGVLLVVGVSTAIGKAANYEKLLDALRAADAAWLPLCLLGEVLAYTGYVLAYRETAAVDGGPRLDLRTTLQIVAAGFGALVVATGAGTLAVNYWALRRAGASAQEALARGVIGLNAMNWAVLGTAACVSGAALLAGVGGDAPVAVCVAWLAVVPPCVAAAFWVTAPRRYARLADPDAGGRFRRLFATAVHGVQIVRLQFSPSRRAIGPIGSALYWAGDILCLWAALRAFDVRLGVPALVLAFATGYVATALPLPAGGAGGVDAAMTYALTLVGVPLAPALLGTFTYRFFNFWLPLIPALAVLPAVRHLGRSSQEPEPALQP